MSEKTKEDAVKRIKEEFEEINNNSDSLKDFSVKYLNDNDFFKWQITLEGPKDTPYKGGSFILIAEFPEDYPNHGPTVVFRTPIYHVNINYQKNLDPLGYFWSACLSTWYSERRMTEVFTELLTLIKNPHPESSYGLERAEELRYNKDLYDEKVKIFTKKYANPKSCNIFKEYEEDWNFNIF